MSKRTVVALALAVTALVGGAVSAEENANLTLRSGERLSGQLLDMGGAGFTVRVNGQERQIPTNEVALIDFSGGSMSSSDWDRVSNGQHVIWLRNGDTITGQLVDVGGTSPLRITVQANGNNRDLQSSEIARIALARPSNTAPTTGVTTPSGGQSFNVSAQQQWTPTGIAVRQGDTITINANGEIRIGGENDNASASGVVNQRFDARAPLPRTLVGALIGRIGNGRPFGIGTQAQIQAPDTGQLFLGINDSNVSDNQGEFQVQVQTSATRSRRR